MAGQFTCWHPLIQMFTPMNLRWTNTDLTTRKVLLKELPILCDFIHVSDPTYRSQHGEDLTEVPAGKAIMCLDVEATNSAKGQLLGPGAYRFFLYVAAGNFPARDFTVEVCYDDTWHVNQDQMFDQEISFRMRRVRVFRETGANLRCRQEDQGVQTKRPGPYSSHGTYVDQPSPKCCSRTRLNSEPPPSKWYRRAINRHEGNQPVREFRFPLNSRYPSKFSSKPNSTFSFGIPEKGRAILAW